MLFIIQGLIKLSAAPEFNLVNVKKDGPALETNLKQGWSYLTRRFAAVFLVCPSLALLGGFGKTPGPGT